MHTWHISIRTLESVFSQYKGLRVEEDLAYGI